MRRTISLLALIVLLSVPPLTSASAQTPPAPVITSFAPISGPAGTTVTIDGIGLGDTTSVTFNGVVASTFTVVTATQITAVVPPGATTGPVAVVTPTGVAVSPVSFTVTPQGIVLSCPFSGGGGDFIERGFYISNYQGTNIDSVTLRHTPGIAGTYQITLTAHLGTYDGPVIGTSSAEVTFPLGLPQDVVFQFGGAAVPAGSTIAFSQTGDGPGPLFYDVGLGLIGDPSYTACPGVTETEGTTPPLDVFRRASVGVIVTQAPAPAQTYTRTLRFRLPVRVDADSLVRRNVSFRNEFADIETLCVTFFFERNLLDATEGMEYAWGPEGFAGSFYGFDNLGPDPLTERTSCLITGHPELTLLLDGREVLWFRMSTGSVRVTKIVITLVGVAA